MANLVLCQQSRTLMDTHRSLTTKPLQLRKAPVEKEVLFKQNSTIAMDIMVDMMTIKLPKGYSNGLCSQ